MSLEKFSEDQFIQTFKFIYKRVIENKVKSINPKAYVLGGQQGSGKTTLHEIFKNKLNYNAIAINGDDYRKYHPNFRDIQKVYGVDAVKYTQTFANKIVEKLIDKLSNEKYNLIIEGTLRTADIPLKTCNNLKDRGYHVELSIMGVKPEISWKSTLLRYEQMSNLGMNPRAIPKEQHDNVVDEITFNTEKIYRANVFDNITIYQRNKVCVYDQTIFPDVNPTFVLNNILNSKNISLEEEQQLFNIEKNISIKEEDNSQFNKSNPYFYEEKSVFRNKFGIKEIDELRKAESDFTTTRLLSVDVLADNTNIDYDYLKKINEHIFKDVYDFAGKDRRIQIEKPEKVLGGDTVHYTLPQEITTAANKAIQKMDQVNWNSLNIEEKASQFSQLTAELWQVHPFIKGNTMTIMTFASHYAEKHGFPLDKEILKENTDYVRNALVKASDGMYADHKYLNKIMKDAITIGEEINIMQEISSAGFNPTNKLIQDMKGLNRIFNKNHTVKDLKNLYNNINNLPLDKKSIVEIAVSDFKEEEKKEIKGKHKIKQNELYPER